MFCCREMELPHRERRLACCACLGGRLVVPQEGRGARELEKDFVFALLLAA